MRHLFGANATASFGNPQAQEPAVRDPDPKARGWAPDPIPRTLHDHITLDTLHRTQMLGDSHYETRFSSWLLWQADPHAHRADPAGRVDGLRLGLDRRGLRQRRRHIGCLCIGSDHQDPGGHRHHADARAHPSHVCDDCDVPRSTFRRPLYCGAGRFGSAGGRRLARCALRQAGDPHQGVHPDHAQDLRTRGPGGI